MYTSEKNTQILISLMKAHGVNDIIISPGSMNHIFAACVQEDPDFRVYSCIDERSAAYMACGMAEEKGRPVALSCTGATASRDYMPGLTEAYYRKLPVLAITSLSTRQFVGQLMGQQIDRSVQPKDALVESVYIPPVKDEKDRLVCEREINKALLALTFNGGGPVHIDMGTTFGKLEVETLPEARVIRRFTHLDSLPEIPKGRIAVMMGVHKYISEELEKAIDNFCATHDAIVITPNPRSYRGRYAATACLLFSQLGYNGSLNRMDLMIHIGEVNTDAVGFVVKPKEVWRVSEDGQLKDRYDKLTAVFQMSELEFFRHYTEEGANKDSQIREFEAEDTAITHRLVYRARTIAYLNDELYYYRKRKGSISEKKDTVLYYDLYKAYLQKYQDLFSLGFPKGKLQQRLLKESLNFLMRIDPSNDPVYQQADDYVSSWEGSLDGLKVHERNALKIWRLNKQLFHAYCRERGWKASSWDANALKIWRLNKQLFHAYCRERGWKASSWDAVAIKDENTGKE